MPKINDLPVHNNPSNADEFPLTHEVSPGTRETRKLSFRALGDWILKIGAKIYGIQPNSIIVVNSNGEIDNVPVQYNAALGALVIGNQNTSSALASLIVEKNSNPSFPGNVFEARNNHPNAPYASYFRANNDGSIDFFDSVSFKYYQDPVDQAYDGVEFYLQNINQTLRLNHQGTLNVGLHSGSNLAEVIDALMETQLVLQKMGVIEIP